MVAATAVLAGCTTHKGSVPTKLDLPHGDITFGLLENGELVASEPGRHKLIGKRRFARSELSRAGFPLLAFGHGAHKRLYVLAPTKGRDTLAVVDPDRLWATARWRLPRSVAYRAVVVGPRTGKLYLFGNRKHGKASMGPGEDAVVTVVSPHGAVQRTWTVRRAGGHDWFVYAGGISPDERHLLLSYHSPDTRGIDVVTLAGSRHRRCHPNGHRRPSEACLVTHGDFAFDDGRIIATTGDPERIDERTLTGRVTYTYDSRLKRNHLMEFATDLRHDKISPIGPCDYTGGMSVIDLNNGSTHVLAAPAKSPEEGPAEVCGTRARFLAEQHAVVLAASDSLRYVDAGTGAIRQQVDLPASAADVAVLNRR